MSETLPETPDAYPADCDVPPVDMVGKSRSPRLRNNIDDEELRKVARRIFRKGCDAVNPRTAILNALTLYDDTLTVVDEVIDLKAYEEVIVLGVGKASIGMVEGVESLMQDRISKGIVITKYQHAEGHTLSSKFEVYEANHPTPDENGVRATARILEVANAAGPQSLVLCCISGGSTALLVAPADNITLAELKEATELLLGCGCPIEEKNAVLKHLSRVKGGQLLAAAQPARVITMILSDVVGDPLDAIGSGPTVPDHSTFVDCLKILGAHNIFDKFPKSCLDRLVRGAAGLIAESPKESDAVFNSAVTKIVAGNKTAVDAAIEEARAAGYNTLPLSTFMEGEASEVAKTFAAIAKEEVKFHRPLPLPACIVAGGETTVTLPPHPGIGGRNQLMALSALLHLRGLQGVAFLAGGTDGGDGPKNDATGAVVTGGDFDDAVATGLDAQLYLERCDAYTFFQQLETTKYGHASNVLHLRDGPTGTNVADLMVLVVR